MKADLRLHGVLVGWKCIGLDYDFVARRRRTVKRNHHQVQIYGERVHHHHFAGQCSDQPRGGCRQDLVIRHPGIFGVKVALHSMAFPVLQFLFYIGARGFGL